MYPTQSNQLKIGWEGFDTTFPGTIQPTNLASAVEILIEMHARARKVIANKPVTVSFSDLDRYSSAIHFFNSVEKEMSPLELKSMQDIINEDLKTVEQRAKDEGLMKLMFRIAYPDKNPYVEGNGYTVH
jgi:hypothetical protein